MLGRSLSVGLVGLEGHLVEVEADVANGLPAFTLVGLPDAALTEARDRVRAASANAGCPLPSRRITVNLSPAALPKAGTAFDLAVAAALLAASGTVPAASVAGRVHLGELGLDGRVRPVRGVLPAVVAAVAAGRPRLVVPEANTLEARLVPGAEVTGVRHLLDVVALHRGEPPPSLEGVLPHGGRLLGDRVPHPSGKEASRPAPDLADVVGQPDGRHALEVAAVGGHHLLMVGPPGAGKTMLAERLPGLLPDLTQAAALEVTAVHSLAGTLDPDAGLRRRPPFENPHHTTTVAALVGGGSGIPRPGAASRAHRGVLFLDEAPEFGARALEALRQPLEHGQLVIQRAMGVARFPARFQLVMAANPCPCGMSGGKGDRCVCSPLSRRRYLGRLSGPLLDRVDLQVEVQAVSRAEMARATAPESTARVGARIRAARETAAVRFTGLPWACNADVPGAWLRGRWRLASGTTRDLDLAVDRGRLSIRGYDRVLRIAWSLADLAGRNVPDRDDVGQALLLRCRGAVAAA
ncbi:MAG: magnesium chelatase family protein [Actinomycetota bacterium]|nr:magnesium chelatase family protein [Actinomycetota bacterium]